MCVIQTAIRIGSMLFVIETAEESEVQTSEGIQKYFLFLFHGRSEHKQSDNNKQNKKAIEKIKSSGACFCSRPLAGRELGYERLADFVV